MKKVEVALKQGSETVDSVEDFNQFGSQVLLPMIEKMLEKNKLEFKDLTAVEVETGPGSYTGLKVGVSVANALGYSLNIPVNGKEIETELTYS